MQTDRFPDAAAIRRAAPSPLRSMLLAAGLLVGMVLGPASAVHGAGAATDDLTLIRGVRLFDGDRMHAMRSVLVRGNRIADADFRGRIPARARLVECDGCTLMPGLIDSHVHAFEHADLPLLTGVTTQLDMFMASFQAAQVRHRMKAGTLNGRSDLFSAGTLATAPRGHGTEFGIPIPTVKGPADAQAFVDARIAEGSDYIKIILETRPGAPALDAATVKALVEAAHRRKRLALVNAATQEAAMLALQSGADGLTHVFADTRVSERFLALARKKRSFIISTYSVKEVNHGRAGGASVLAARELAEVLTEQERNLLRYTTVTDDDSARLDAVMAYNLRALRDRGIPVLAGSDAGNPGVLHGFGLHRELELLVKAGLPALDVLRSATSLPADTFKLNDRGRVAKGLKADLLLVRGDPGRNILDTRAVVAVWKNGIANDDARLARVEHVKRRSGTQPAPLALPADGRIGLFTAQQDGIKMAAPFGRWDESLDASIGGNSRVEIGAGTGPAGQAAAVVRGEVRDASPFPWAGLSFMPGDLPFSPANLSSSKGIRFMLRGKGAPFQFQAFCQEGRFRPVTRDIAPADEWQQVEVLWSQMGSFNPATATAFGFAAAQRHGSFRFELADVELISN